MSQAAALKLRALPRASFGSRFVRIGEGPFQAWQRALVRAGWCNSVPALGLTRANDRGALFAANRLGFGLSHLRRSAILLAGTDGSSLAAPVGWLECAGSDRVPRSAHRIEGVGATFRDNVYCKRYYHAASQSSEAAVETHHRDLAALNQPGKLARRDFK
jgi:hypothetical protein